MHILKSLSWDLLLVLFICLLGCQRSSQTRQEYEATAHAPSNVQEIIEWAEAFGTSDLIAGQEYKVGRTDILVDEEYISNGKKIAEIEATLVDLLTKRDGRLHPVLATTALGFVGSKKSVPVLTKLLDDNELAPFAVTSLANLGLPECIIPLSEVLINDGRATTNHLYAAEGLAKIRDPKAMEVLKAALAQREEQVNRLKDAISKAEVLQNDHADSHGR
jgi:hypothetical protein